MPGEIMAPASSLEDLSEIFKAGADAAYIGLKGYCRYEEAGVPPEEVPALVDFARKGGKKLYLAMNRIPKVGRENNFLDGLCQAVSRGIDGVILNDAGLVSEVRKRNPDLFIMTSIGTAPLNTEEALFLKELGADRVLLPEGLAKEEIGEFSKIPDLKLEVFWQGLKDFTYTGKCYISSYFRQLPEGKGSAKRGGCFRVCEAGYDLMVDGKNLPVDISPEKFRFKGDPDPAIDSYKITGSRSTGKELSEIIIEAAAWAGGNPGGK
ncbi:MAG: U32 family peptidase [Chloroflexi bacterium]|nr:U32 family peptidase [Chloroflexota bacterium]